MKVKGQRSKVKISGLTFALCTFSFALCTSPIYAAVDIGKTFGFGDITNLSQGVGRIIPTAFAVATALVVFYFLFGGFKLLKSAGEESEVKGAKDMITHAVIGFVLLMASFIVLQFLLSNLFGIDDLKIIEGI